MNSASRGRDGGQCAQRSTSKHLVFKHPVPSSNLQSVFHFSATQEKTNSQSLRVMSQQSTFPDIFSLLRTWYGNFTRNTSQAFTRLTPKDAIRIIIVACAYMLIIRPFLVRLGMRVQAKQHEQANKEADENAQLNGNHLKGEFAIPGVDSDSEDESGTKSDVKTGEWGRKARLRQRRVVRKALEIKERRLLEDESDDDIKEFLES